VASFGCCFGITLTILVTSKNFLLFFAEKLFICFKLSSNERAQFGLQIVSSYFDDVETLTRQIAKETNLNQTTNHLKHVFFPLVPSPPSESLYFRNVFERGGEVEREK
jgi:hypothetical protein